MPKLYYFQAPMFTINPESETAPKLGSIFSSLERLTAPLNQSDYIYVPSNLTNQSVSTDFNETSRKGISTEIGLNANVAQGIAGSADVTYAFAKEKNSVYACELLETLEFEPDNQFITDCITASQPVQAFLENSLLGRKRVYMITGLKIATGFRTSTCKHTQHGPSLQIGVDATAFGIPVETGPEIGMETTRSRTVDQGRALNKIVFAYRVVKIKQKRDGEARYKYKSGGKYAVEDDDDSEDEEGAWDLEPLDEEEISNEFPDLVPISIEQLASVLKPEVQDAS